MTFLAVIGAVVITGVLVYLTLFYVAGLLMQSAFAGLRMLDFMDWIFIVGAGIILAASWYVWWGLVAIHFSIGIN